MRNIRYLVLSVVAALMMAPMAFAGGSNVYANGAEGFWNGAVPPPGTYYVNYDVFYSAHEFVDNSGGEWKVGPFAGFKTDVFANISRFLYVSDKQILGANWAAHLFLIYQDVNIKAAAGNSHVSGLGDAIVSPFILAWHWPNLHIATSVDIYVPIGDYDAGRLANLSCNVFVYEPVLAVTYLTPLKGWTVSGKFMYDLPAKNNDYTNPVTGASGDLKYGEEFHVDYSIDYTVNENLKAGIGGYYYKQTTNDQFNGMDVSTRKGRVWAVGPGVEYVPARFKGRLILSYRAMFEMDAKNRPEGMANWLKAIWVF